MAPTSLFTPAERAKRIVEALDKVAIIFPIGEEIDSHGEESLRILGSSDKIIIGNHTYNHLKLANTKTDVFIDNIHKMHSKISVFNQFQAFFRYPYLSEGGANQKEHVTKALSQIGYEAVPVTINSRDFLLEYQLQDALRNDRVVNFEKLKSIYVSHIIGCARYAEAVYDGDVGVHVLLLHSNDLAALFLKDLIFFLKKEGWEIISAKKGLFYAPKREFPLNEVETYRRFEEPVFFQKDL